MGRSTTWSPELDSDLTDIFYAMKLRVVRGFCRQQQRFPALQEPPAVKAQASKLLPKIVRCFDRGWVL